jgi:catechol-2,3-dioxygenase
MQFDAVELFVPDMDAARAFYTGVLQLAELPPAEEGIALAAGRTRLTFRAAQAGEQPRYHFAFSVPFARFDAARRMVAAHTPLIAADGDEVIVHASWDAVAFYFRDPAGNIVECIARRVEPTHTPQTPHPLGIGSVCEVGLVVNDVPALTTRLRNALTVTPFRGSEGATFTALGDEEGLLIVVQREREWYPNTGLAAAPAPLRLALSLTDETQHMLSGPPYRCDRLVNGKRNG